MFLVRLVEVMGVMLIVVLFLCWCYSMIHGKWPWQGGDDGDDDAGVPPSAGAQTGAA